MNLLHSTRARRGQQFPRAQQSAGVQRIAQARHYGQVVVRKHAIHETDFLQPDAVLAGNAAAALEAFG
jgi:hypothetical protein